MAPIAAYYLYMAADGFLLRLTVTIFSVFAIIELGLDPLRLILLGTALEASYFLFEIPTGVLADTVSRRLSVIIGAIGSGVALVVLGLSTGFAMALASQVLLGVFLTFMSGADVAWLTDEVGEEEARPVYVRGDQVWHVTALGGIVASVALASIDLRLPIVASGVGLVILGIVLAIVMPEEHFMKRERVEGERMYQGMVATFSDGVRAVRSHPILFLILATAALHGASTEGFDRLSDFHLLRDIGLPGIGDLDPVVWFGILQGVGLLVGLGALALLHRRVHLVGHTRVARVLAAVDIFLVGTVVAFGLTGSFGLALVTYWLVSGLRSVREPVFTSWINQGLDPRTRATINSMGSQADAIGQTVGGPGLGLVGNRSVPLALVVSGALRLPSLLLYVRAIRRGSVGTLEPDAIEEEIQLED